MPLSFRSVAIAYAALSFLPAAATAQRAADVAAMDSSEAPAALAATEVMSMQMAADPHLRLTAARPGSAADTRRANELVGEIRGALDRYRDVRVAEADGFRKFLPGVRQPIYHYTSWRRALEASLRFDPDQPTSLLYRDDGDGRMRLVGVMYTAPAHATEDELDARVPLSVAHWHEHVNWCLPPRGDLARWRDQRDGRPVFGPRSPIATRAGCDSVGGRFRSRVFGWMVHIQAFASDDPAVIWSMDHGAARP